MDETLCSTLGEQLTEGGEAHVYKHGDSLVKSIGLDYFIEPVLALDRISLHNTYFPETFMNVLGYGRSREGDFFVVVEQSFIQGSRMTNNEIFLHIHHETIVSHDVLLDALCNYIH